MKTVTIFWKGESKSGNFYIGVNVEDDGFITRRFLQLTKEKYDTMPDSGDVKVPASALA